MLDILQNIGHEYSAAKKQFEASMEPGSELNAELLRMNEYQVLLLESIKVEIEQIKDQHETEVNKDEL